MAPGSSSRSRPAKKKQKRKKGLMRMDAVFEHLVKFQFSKREITRAVKSLLQEYGEENWFFLEDDGYTLVIETILDNQKNKKEHIQEQEDEESQEEEEEEDVELTPVPVLDLPLLQIEHVSSQQNQEGGGQEQEQELNDDASKKNGDVSEILNNWGIVLISNIGVQPGLKRTPCGGFLVETDSETGSDDEDEE